MLDTSEDGIKLVMVPYECQGRNASARVSVVSFDFIAIQTRDTTLTVYTIWLAKVALGCRRKTPRRSILSKRLSCATPGERISDGGRS